ncbi:unnamed protein product [Heligmosomoides polygyrus]|uniref:Utp13 domain-containing protein n=1 Tax=Heligmosomoides polygyrus TaxID=6339 RepID=A0A183GGS2_HELPZ|nr:unnamed protein product [Heligmosomoides polygyrus]
MNPLVMLFVLVGKGEGVENGDEESQKSSGKKQARLLAVAMDSQIKMAIEQLHDDDSLPSYVKTLLNYVLDYTDQMETMLLDSLYDFIALTESRLN